jgi:hypothetical protein
MHVTPAPASYVTPVTISYVTPTPLRASLLCRVCTSLCRLRLDFCADPCSTARLLLVSVAPPFQLKSSAEYACACEYVHVDALMGSVKSSRYGCDNTLRRGGSVTQPTRLFLSFVCVGVGSAERLIVARVDVLGILPLDLSVHCRLPLLVFEALF